MATTIPLPSTTEVQITRVVKALYDAAPGNLYLNAFKEYAAENGGVVGVADALLYEHHNKTNADLAQLIVDNLGLAKVDEATGATGANSAADNAKAFLLWQFNVAEQTGATRGQVLVDALNNLATLGSDEIFGPAAAYFNQSIEYAYLYSRDPANVAINSTVDDPVIGEDGVVVQPGQTFTLTAGPDQADTTGSSKNGGLIASTFKFTSANETVTAVAGTFTAGDVLADGSTTDADVLNVTDIGAVPIAASVTNIETINIDVKAAGGGLNMASILGTKSVNVTANANAQLTNVTPASAPTIGLSGSNVLIVGLTSLAGTTAAGTAETLNVKFNGATATTTTVAGLTLDTAAAATAGQVLETLNIESAGSVKNTVTLALNDADASGGTVESIAKAVVTGAADLELRGAAGIFNGVELNGSGHTGVLTINADFDGGAAVVGLNAEKFSGVDQYIVRDTAVTAGATGFGLFNVASGATIRLADDIAAASIITVAGSAAGTADSVNLLLKNRATTATDVDVTGGLTINNVESIKITSTGAPTTGDTQSSLTLNADKLATLTLDGDSDLAVALGAGTIAATNTANIVIDGSAATGKLTFNANNIADTAAGGRIVTIKGGTNDDTLTGASTVAVKNVFDLSAGGKDRVNLNVGDTNDSIVGFANGDKIALGAVAGDFINGLSATEITAAEQATIEAAANLAAAASAAAAAVTAYAANTAVLFSYQGNQYILMDEATFGAYDAGTDAIVKVSGLTSTTTFDAGTFLFAA